MSNLDENLTTEYLYSEPVVTAEVEKKESGKGAYVFLAVFFFILALVGLFVGLVTAAWAKFQNVQLLPFINETTGKPSTFSYSMAGYFGNIMNDLFKTKIISQIYAASPLSLKIWLIILNLTLVFSTVLVAVFALALMIVAIVTKSKPLAKNCAFASGIVLFLVYGGYFFLTYLCSGMVDAPSALVGGLVLVTLVVAAIAHSKVYGLLSSLLLILTGITIMMFNYADASITQSSSLIAFDMFKSVDKFLGIMVPMLIAVLALNLIISAVRIAPKKYYVFDAVRYGVQLFVVILTIIAFIVRSKYVFVGTDTWSIFTEKGQTLATVLVLVCSIATFVVALLETLLAAKKETVEQEIVTAERPVAYEPAYLGYAPVIQPVVVTQQPVYQQPVYQPAYQQPAPEPQAAPAPQPVETHVYVQQPERPDVPVTEFERKMQSLARGESSVYDATPIPVSDKHIGVETHAYERPYKNKPQNNSTYVYEGSQYVYDPFIKTLNVQERNEFGDLFIANIYGLRSYLPTYVIGGDNKLFFDRVFIYLGCYRNYISQGLLEKIYLYVSKQ